MSLRIFSAAGLIFAFSACGAQSGVPEGDAIDCAIGPGAAYSNVCTLEFVASESDETTRVFAVHGPEGGFRKVRFDRQSGKLEAFDGADTLNTIEVVSRATYEFELSGDRYIVPLGRLWDRPSGQFGE